VQRSKLVCFVGYAGSGKSTAAEFLRGEGYIVIKFADPLKAMLRALGLTDFHLEGEGKELPCDLLGGRTPRRAMQTLGTEWGRELIHSNLWASAWHREVRAALNRGRHVVADDLRFLNEYKAAQSLGAKVVRISRPSSDATTRVHESERQVADVPVSAVIFNRGTVENLKELVDITVCGGTTPLRGLHSWER
jgi:hypothetical protein